MPLPAPVMSAILSFVAMCSPRGCDLVFGFGLATQPVIEPPDDVLEPLHAMPRLTGARELMRLVGEAHHHRGDVPELQRAEHLVAARLGWRAAVTFAEHEHQRRRDIADVADRRACAVVARILERRRAEPLWVEEREVRRIPPVGPARDIAL